MQRENQEQRRVGQRVRGAAELRRVDMPIMTTEEQRLAPSVEDLQEMDRYGIVRVPADIFRYREFRYTNFQDALAQAKRDAESGQRAGEVGRIAAANIADRPARRGLSLARALAP